MKKQIIFNIGGGLSSYIEVDDYKIMIDLGSCQNVSPIDNFLIPLFKERGELKNEDGKYPSDHFPVLAKLVLPFTTHKKNPDKK